ncbi:hypothetical protein F5Y15DRAFT_232068 [Xylariaceae sp. FL0016]|nr:hypothetical protein F5Y15DRAFT_232068 [Xylariaceae sp. FL0016]
MAFVPTTRPEIRAWLQRFHDVSDSLDADQLETIYVKDARVQFSNHRVMIGVDSLRGFFLAIWPSLDTMKHTPDGFDMVNDTIYQPCHIAWQVKGDPEKERIVIPAFAVFHLVMNGEDQGLIKSAEFYMDTSPLMAAIQRASSST